MIGQTTISGNILDAKSNEPIIGANILVKNASVGTVSDLNGNFKLTITDAFPVILEISYTGYSTYNVTVANADTPISVLLETGTILEEVVISASRKPEKIQDAPASVSILTAKNIAGIAVANPISLLDNTVGVSIEKQGVSRTNISMRGASDLFATSTFVMMDYRSLIGSGLNTFDAGATTLSTIDVDKIEVIRGPGSALYGPGVTAGVVHFLTKDPFKYPGTTIEVIAGNQNTFKTSVRHAGHNEARTIGYKITGNYYQANEWDLDPDNATDAATIATFQDDIVDPKDGTVVGSTGGELDEKGVGYSGTASLYFRPKNTGLNVVATGGFNKSDGLYWSQQGEGYVNATDVYAQGRVNWKGLFFQAYYNTNFAPNDAADKGFLYRTGQVSAVDRKQFETQLQYNFDLSAIKTNITFGGDYRIASFESETRTFGRYEAEDDFDIYGGYIQTKTNITDKLDLVLAARYDEFSAIDEGAIAPRVAVVYKAKPNHTFRASYNKAFAPNSALDLFGDLQIANLSAFDLWLHGNNIPQTFNNIETTWFIPGIPATSGIGMDVGTAYGFLTAAIAQQIAAGNPNLTPLAPLLPILGDPGFIGAIASTGGFSAGVPIDLAGNILAPEGTPASSLREDNTYEIGYKGVIDNKLSLSIDLYQANKKNFTGLRQISPLVVLPTLGDDVAAALIPILTGTLIAQGLDPATAQATASGVAGAYVGTASAITAPGGNLQPLGTVESDQMPEGGLPHVAYGYRNFGEITYYGLDFGASYFLDSNIRLFGNYSWVSQNSFTGEDIGEKEGSTNRYDLNFSDHRVRFGANFEPEKGLQGGFSVKYNNSFQSTLGFYSGLVKARTLVDANVGYKFENGLYLNLAIDNLFNDKYRSFPTMPIIGTRIFGTVRYSF